MKKTMMRRWPDWLSSKLKGTELKLTEKPRKNRKREGKKKKKEGQERKLNELLLPLPPLLLRPTGRSRNDSKTKDKLLKRPSWQRNKSSKTKPKESDLRKQENKKLFRKLKRLRIKRNRINKQLKKLSV